MKKFHITKRSHIDWWKAWLIRLLSIVLALLISAVVIVVLTGLNPLDVFTKIYEGTFATKDNFWVSMQKIAMLLCIALAVTPCYKMKFWNLGAQGQVLIAGLASTACMFYIKDAMQNWSLLLVMLVASVITGAVWAVIPAIFKAKWNTNETLFTLMMNYVAIQLVGFFCLCARQDKTGKENKRNEQRNNFEKFALEREAFFYELQNINYRNPNCHICFRVS
mgnify:CR=1 FL=1